MIFSCSGSEKFKRPQPEYIKCPGCHEELEIWTDEIEAVCPKCKNKVRRKQEKSCLDWCSYAKECVGAQKYSSYLQNKALTQKEKLLKELEDYFGSDLKRINHAKSVLHWAEILIPQEKADWHIVAASSLLHDVGIKAAEEKYGSNAPEYQEKEGPEIARKILLDCGFKKKDIEEICEIIAHHHSPGIVNTRNFKVLYDSDLLVNLNDEADIKDKEKLKIIIQKKFLTNSAKVLAESAYL